jgi:methylenetetrahydrofolate dehydrogenase (NADP+)/methenyltetrahydrofolate cyclohydrolase
LPATTTQEELLAQVKRLNEDEAIHGILVQMPLPKHLDADIVIRSILPEKDVDGFHPVNVGKSLIGDRDGFVPCTPAGVQEMLARSGTVTKGKECVIVGRSNIVGKPMMALMVQNGPNANATVTVCHSATRDLKEHTLRADILIVAAGKPKMVTGDMVKEGAVVIDVGINRIADPSAKSGFRLVGDVDFEGARERASKITPVPGGVGPMTIAMLLKNTVRAAEQSAAR